jgi:type I restriction enzyme S subunit
MSNLRLLDCIEFAGSSVSSFNGSRLYLSTGALKGNIVNRDELEEVTFTSRPSRANLNVEVGDIVFAKMQNTNKVLTITEETKDLIVSTGFYVVRPKGEYDHEFIFQFLNSREFNRQKDKYCSGATQKAINNDGLQNIIVPELDITQQRNIGRALEISRNGLQMRREQITTLNKLQSDTFADMFYGEFYSQLTLNDVCNEIYRYPTFYGFEYQETGIPVLKIGNITMDGMVDDNLDNYDFITTEIHNRYPRTHLKMFDSVMAVRGDGSTAKRIGIVISENLVDANISPNLLRLSANPDLCAPAYLYFFLMSKDGQSKLEQHVTRTAKKTITATNIKTIDIPLPPMEDQLRFQEIVLKIERQKAQLYLSLEEMETIYKSTVQKAFNGELFQ